MSGLRAKCLIDGKGRNDLRTQKGPDLGRGPFLFPTS